MPDVCAVCGKAECAYPARDRDGLTVFEFGQAAQSITREQLAMLRSDHAYEQRIGQLGTRPIAEIQPSAPAPRFDWPLKLGMWLVLALLLAMAWYGIGCGASSAGSILDRTETALRLLQCVEQVMPDPVGGTVEAVAKSDRAAVVTSTVSPIADAGALPPLAGDRPDQPAAASGSIADGGAK